MSLGTAFRRAVPLGVAFGLTASAWAQAASPAPGTVSPIRVWGHGHRGQDYIQTLLSAWQKGFSAAHPSVTFENHLYGNASALGGIYTGVADLAILDREASFIEVDAYQQGTGHDPFAIPVATGSVSMPHHAPALAIYVNRSNPLSQLTLQQLDGIFDSDHRRGDRVYKTWGDVGVRGESATHPIQMYMQAIQTAEVQFFERAALKGSQKFSCCLTLFSQKPDMSAEQQIEAAVEKDKFGIGLSSQPASRLKAVRLAASEGALAVLATPETLSAGTYPLARTVYIYANRPPKSPVPANVADFLAYVVSPEGQAVVARTGGYLPLSPELAAKAKELLQ